MLSFGMIFEIAQLTLGQTKGAAGGEEIFLKDLEDKNSDRRQAAVLLLTQKGFSPKAKDRIIKAFKQEKNASVLAAYLDLFVKNRMRSEGLRLIFYLLNHPQNQVPDGKLLECFKKLASPSELPLLTDELKSTANAKCAFFLFGYFQELLGEGVLNPQWKEKIIKTALGLLNNERVSPLAVQFLAEMGERKVIPFLLKVIEEKPECSLAVLSLARLRNSAEEFESVLQNILNSAKYSKETKLSAAFALASAGKRDGLELLMNELREEATKPRPHPQKLLQLINLITAIIKPEDAKLVNTFLESSHPGAIMIGLDFLKQLKDSGSVPLILTKLKSDNPDVRFNALLTLAICRKSDDDKTQKTIEEEIKFWKYYLKKTENEHDIITERDNRNSGLPPAQWIPDAKANPKRYALYFLVKKVLPEIEKQVGTKPG